MMFRLLARKKGIIVATPSGIWTLIVSGDEGRGSTGACKAFQVQYLLVMKLTKGKSNEKCASMLYPKKR